MNIRTRIGGLMAAALTLTLAACGNTTTASPSTSTAAATSMSMSASMPMSSSGGGSATTGTGTVSAAHNDADITFTQMMLVHHQGAIEMADLAPERASSADITQLAARIKAAQTPEIEKMTSWLKAWGAPMAAASSPAMGGMTGMDHGGSSSAGQMPGMMTDQQMQQLKAADGAAFDKMFLQLMITHHQGALEMAQTEKTSGQNTDALALADAIIKSQTAEIAEMNRMLQEF